MNITSATIVISSFEEMKAFANEKIKNVDCDIVIEGKINAESYCLALLQKFNKMPLSHFSNFIHHQISLVSNQRKWLLELEEFIYRNEALFKSKTDVLKYNKIFYLIEKKQLELQSTSVSNTKHGTPKRLINAEAEERHFSFFEVKEQIKKLENFNEKVMFLTEEIFEYRQADIISLNAKLLDYDLQCEQLILKLQTIRQLKTEFENEQKECVLTQSKPTKIQFNCNVNQFVDIFYQLHRELFSNGKPIIDGNINDMVAMIVHSFVDKDGNEISPQTVETILKPSRGDKRPKPHKRLDIDKLL